VNAASEGARKLLDGHEELLREQVRGDLLAVMETREGRRFVWKLIGDAGVFRQSFAQDALSTAFNEGRRSHGLELLDRAQNEAPELFLKAQSEFVEGQKKHNALAEAAEAEALREQEENDIV
jgi:hypothetical protein